MANCLQRLKNDEKTVRQAAKRFAESLCPRLPEKLKSSQIKKNTSFSKAC